MPDLKKLITLEALQAALPSWLKSSSKPSYTADEISDTNTTNKFVTSTEKNTWNAKGTYSKPSGGIPKTDLASAVQTSLGKADSALQSETDPTVPSWAKQTNKPTYNSDEISDTNRTHKFATAAQLTQINTNQTNILYALNVGAKNLLNIIRTDNNSQATINDDGSITINHSAVSGNYTIHFFTDDGSSVGYKALPTEWVGKYFSGVTSYVEGVRFIMEFSDNGTNWSDEIGVDSPNTKAKIPSTHPYYRFGLKFNNQIAASNYILKPMIADEIVYNTVGYKQPPALPNSDLTGLQAEDRAALAEEIDAGAKNKLKYDMTQLAALNPSWTVSGSTIRPSSDTHITFTLNSDMSIRVQSDGSNAQAELCICTSNYSSLKAGTYVLSGCPTGGNSSTTYDLRLIEQSSPKKYNADVGSAKEIIWSAQYSYTCNIMIRANQNIDITFKPMVCTKAAFGVSQKFVPYRPSYQDLVNATNIEVLSGSDIFTANTNYTIISDSVIYKQGKHIFGNLIVSKSDGNFTSVEIAIGQMKTAYRPVSMFSGNNTTFNTSQWGVTGIGYCYIPPSSSSVTNVSVKTRADDTQMYNVVMIKLDYCTK